MVFKFKELNSLFKNNESKFLDLLYKFQVKECKRLFKDLLFYYLLTEIQKNLKQNKDIIFYIDLSFEKKYQSLEFFDEIDFLNSLDLAFRKMAKLMPNKFFVSETKLPESATISDLTSETLDSIFVMIHKKFNFKKLLKTIDAKLLHYKEKFDVSDFYF